MREEIKYYVAALVKLTKIFLGFKVSIENKPIESVRQKTKLNEQEKNALS